MNRFGWIKNNRIDATNSERRIAFLMSFIEFILTYISSRPFTFLGLVLIKSKSLVLNLRY